MGSGSSGKTLFDHGQQVTEAGSLQVEMALMMETDPSAIINELIYAVRKGGRIGVIGIYAGFTNHFNIGTFP